VILFWKWLQLPVTKAVGVVKAPADQIFNLIMDYGPERHQYVCSSGDLLTSLIEYRVHATVAHVRFC